MHTRTHAVNEDFTDTASRDGETGWQRPSISLHESCRSDGTWEDQQEGAHCGCTGEVSSRASPEVLGAVDLLSLRAASWTRPSCLEARRSQFWPFQADDCLLTPKSSKSAARSSLYTKRGGLQPTLRGRERNPTCIKQWAALTTWLRMNLHQARTAKRQVCFIGQMSPRLDRWVFDLNPKLPWNEVSAETKQRLRTLPREAEQAFAHKYPFPDPTDWQEKAVKYRPGNSIEAHNIRMGDLVHDLHSLYLKYEVHSRRSSSC